MDTDPILARIEHALESPGLAERLGGLPASDLTSLLLTVLRHRARKVTPAQLARPNALTSASSVEARRFHALDALAYAHARPFEALDLSPVVPFGTNAALGSIDQNNVLSALRASEVVADPTGALALEAARRRRRDRAGVVRLCASQRVTRMQPVEVEGFTPHFRLFSLVTAGRDRGAHRFETEALAEHLRFHVGFLRAARDAGCRIESIELEVSDAGAVAALVRERGEETLAILRTARAHRVGEASEALVRRGVVLPSDVPDPSAVAIPADARARLLRVRSAVLEPLAQEFPGVHARIDLSRLEGVGYYPGLTFRVRANGLPLVDGGFTDWTQRLLEDRKERLLCSAVGTELICKLLSSVSPSASKSST